MYNCQVSLKMENNFMNVEQTLVLIVREKLTMMHMNAIMTPKMEKIQLQILVSLNKL